MIKPAPAHEVPGPLPFEEPGGLQRGAR